MLAKLLGWFEAPQQAPDELSAEEAVTVLMVEIMLADQDLDEREADLIAERLAIRTGDDKATATELVQKAQQRHNETPDLYPFTRAINDRFNEDQKYHLIVDLWRTALADNSIDKLEEHMIRRIADMLYLHHSHFIQAKREAQQES